MFSSKDLFFTPPSGAFQVSKSLRFRASASAYLNRTSVASPTNVKKYTVSVWAKLSKLGDTIIMNTGSSGATGSWIYINSSNQINFNDYCSGSRCQKITTPVYRDPSAFYHIVCTLDTTVPAMKVYVNGVEVTAFGTNTAPTSNANTSLNAASAVVNIGRDTAGASYFDGYLAEYNYIDGQALDPSYFGAFDTSGVWQPITPSVSSYGTNGFYLKFTDTTSTTTLCYDSSGNSNNWTPANISLTSGVTYDSMLDSPTNYSDGGNGVGNYCTINPLNGASAVHTITNANLTFNGTSATQVEEGLGTFSLNSGTWYFEVTVTAVGAGGWIGISPDNGIWRTAANAAAYGYFYTNSGQKYINNSGTSYGASYTTGDIIGVAIDFTTPQITFYKNGATQGAISIAAGSYFPSVAFYGTSAVVNVNFGQRPFNYSNYGVDRPASTFLAINTQNLTTPAITNGAQYMAAVTYTGNGTASTSITASSTNSGNNPNSTTFQPDLVWIKSRSAATNNNLFDSVRTATNYLISNTTAANATNANTLTAFNSNGFTLGTDAGSVGVNINTNTYVAWEWLASGSSGTISPAGTISATGRVNQTAGFSVVTFTGTGTASQSVGHGLGAIPQFIVNKRTNVAGNYWIVYSAALGATKELNFNTTVASTTSGSWGNTTPTANVFYVGSGTDSNGSGDTYITYCWTPISGFSSFGSYTGNGSADGVYVYTGMRPRWLLIKRTDAAGYYWWVWDTSRNTYNATDAILNPNVADAEASGSTYAYDLLSNGFKVRTTSASFNASGGTYIYAAFAENPFKISRAR